MKYTKEVLQKAVVGSYTVSEVCRKIGVSANNGSRTHISHRLRYFGIDTTHFLGQASNVNRVISNKLSADKILVSGVKRSANQLRRALIETGREHVCEKCNMKPLWNGKKLVLQVDHINGVNTDNTPDNLRFLCPNCHTQTSNWGVKNVRGVRSLEVEALSCEDKEAGALPVVHPK